MDTVMQNDASRARSWVLSGSFTPVRFHPLIFFGFLSFCFAVNYPGRVNPDSFEQLEGSVSSTLLTDWHAPVVTWLWSVPGLLAGQPAGALLIQCLCFALFAAVLPTYPRHSAKTIAIYLAEGLFRLALVAIAGIVIKDVLLASFILAAIASFEMARSSGRRAEWLALSIAMAAPCLFVRPTNFLMILIAWALLSVMTAKTVLRYAGGLAIAAILLVSVIPASNFVNRGLLGASNAHAEKQLIIFDVAGISHALHRNEFLTLKQWPQGLPDPVGCYTPKRWNPFFFTNPCHEYADAFDRIAEKTGGLTTWWLSEVVRHPVAYASHRLAYAHKLIRTREPVVTARPPYSDAFNRDGDPRYRSILYNDELNARLYGRGDVPHIARWHDNLAVKPFAGLSSLVFGRKDNYFLALVACVLLLAWGIRRHFSWRGHDQLSTAVAAIGLGNFGMLMFFGVASEGRYLLPTIGCACVAGLIALRRVAGGGPTT